MDAFRLSFSLSYKNLNEEWRMHIMCVTDVLSVFCHTNLSPHKAAKWDGVQILVILNDLQLKETAMKHFMCDKSTKATYRIVLT